MNTPGVDQIRTAFWNVQNLFDVNTSSVAADLGFTPVNGWDRRALNVRLDNIANVLRGTFNGIGPDLIGLCEIENERIARMLMERLGRDDYQLAESRNPGISALDTTLIYSDRLFDIDSLRTTSHLVDLRHPTRDIFEVHLRLRSTDERLTVIVNHWPSRKNEHGDTESLRIAAATHCARLVDQCMKFGRKDYLELSDTEVSLQRLNQRWNANVLVMGDFNDAPWDRSIGETLRAGYSLKAANDAIRFTRGHLPSYRSYSSLPVTLFNPTWQLLARPDQVTAFGDSPDDALLSDQMMVSRGLLMGTNGLQIAGDASGIPEVAILRPDVMTDSDGRPKAFRCDDRTGYSNHFPITATIDVYPTVGSPPDTAGIETLSDASIDRIAHAS